MTPLTKDLPGLFMSTEPKCASKLSMMEGTILSGRITAISEAGGQWGESFVCTSALKEQMFLSEEYS